MRRLLSLGALFGTILVLLVFMLWLRNFEFGAAAISFQPKSLAATGFIVLAAFSMGEFFKLLKIPALLGYIAAGIFFGPNFLPALEALGFIGNTPEALFSSKVISDLNLVNVLTVGVIGTMGGGELKIADIKDNLKTILVVVGLFVVIVLPATGVTILILAEHFPGLIPFLSDATMGDRYAAALLFGVFAVAMSPAATLAILQETRAKGSFTSLVLGTVIVADLALVAMFLLAFQFDEILLSPEGFSATRLLTELPHIAAEFGYALALGVATGLVFILYLRFVKREHLFFTVLIIFATSFIAKLLHAETLLAFLTAGFIVQNLSKHGHEMIHALEKISLPVFVIYFMTQAAQLDLMAVGGFLALTGILTVVRTVALYLGSTLGAAWVNADSTTKRYLWMTFFSRGGVDLVLAAMVAGSPLIPWGTEFQTVIMAIVVVHIIVGPPLLKVALDASGETEGSRRQTREEAEAFDQLPSVGEISSIGASFPRPEFEDEALNERVLELRQMLVDLHRDDIAEPLEQKAEALRDSVNNAREELASSLDRLEIVLTSDEFASPEERAGAVADVHIEYLGLIADNVETWEQIQPEIVQHDQVFELIAHIRNREDFTTIYRVEKEDSLYDVAGDDNAWQRTVKGFRRLRRLLSGRGNRSVPLGRLWRYYVELTVPRYLARAANATAQLNERFWTDLGNHMRRVDDLFDEVFDTVLQSRDPDSSAELDSTRSASSVALERLEEGRAAIEEREQALREQLATCAATALDRYTVSLRETYSRFLDAVARAGTIELPQFRYRPSALFDRSRRAEAQIESRLQRESTVVTGQRGWIVVEWQLVLFLYWLEAYEDRVRSTMGAMIANPISAQLDVLRATCQNLPEPLVEKGWDDLEALREALEEASESDAVHAWPQVAWETWLDEEIRPAIERTQSNLQRMLSMYSQGHAARRLLNVMERRVGKFSERIVLLSEHPDQIAPDAVVPTLRIPLREWFVSGVVRETALRLVEFNERGEAIIRTCLSALEDVQQVLEFNLLTAHHDVVEGNPQHGLDLAAGGLARAGRLIEDMRVAHLRRFNDLIGWIVSETGEIAERAAEPFLEHRPAEIERLMKRRGQTTLAERGENWAMTALNTVVSFARGVYRRYRPLATEVVEEIRGLFVEEIEPIRNADIRRRLHPDERSLPAIPAIYRRLFTPVPLDIPDFYVARESVERRCIEAIVDWCDGHRNSLLLYGDRGTGKRSTLHHVLQGDGELRAALDDIAVHTVMLDDDLQTEAELVRKIGTALPNEPAETMEGLLRFIEVFNDDHIVVIENAEKLFSRTDDGLRVCQRFLRLMNETSDQIMWILLMGTPAVTLLDTAFGILDYFTHAIEIGPLDDDEIQRMIERRHRVSGFRASFRRERPRIRDWIRSPLATSEALRDPKAEYFLDLARLSGGNPMMALLYWLESVELDDTDDHLIWVNTLPEHERQLIRHLALVKRLILAALVQHHTLTPLQLRSILRRDFDEVQTELEHLERLGLVERIVGRTVQAYRLRPMAEGLANDELRDMNMI